MSSLPKEARDRFRRTIRRARRKARKEKKAEAIIQEETWMDMRSPRSWRLVRALGIEVFEDVLSDRTPRLAFIMRGPNPAVLDAEEMGLANEIAAACHPDRGRTRNVASFIKGRVPADYYDRIKASQRSTGFLPWEASLITREG